MTTITIFSKPKCVQCTATYREMDKQNIDYTVVDVTEEEGAEEKVLALGYRQMPVVLVSEDNHWAGFQPERIRSLVA